MEIKFLHFRTRYRVFKLFFIYQYYTPYYVKFVRNENSTNKIPKAKQDYKRDRVK